MTGRSTPTAALAMMMGIKPLQLTIREATTKTLLRVTKANKEKVLGAFNCPHTSEYSVALRMPSVKRCTLFLFDKNYSISLLTRDDRVSKPNRGELWFLNRSKSLVGMATGYISGRKEEILFSPFVAIPWCSKPNR